MEISKDDLLAVLAKFNPWWNKAPNENLPSWKRAAYYELYEWTVSPPAHRAVMLSGPRQVGKTTLVLQVIEQLLQDGIHPSNILYATFDHPIVKLAGLEAILSAWREIEPRQKGQEFLFLDEAQFIQDFGTWVKHQTDFDKSRNIVFTGSATPLASVDTESGVGRWHTLRISTLSFYEYLQLKNIPIPHIPEFASLAALSQTPPSTLHYLADTAQNLIGHFHEYLLRGGFPQTALIKNISQGQELLREDIIDKVLKRDMTAFFGVRRILELEQIFIYFCTHDGGIQDIATLCTNLGVSKSTVNNYIALLEAAHLLHRLPPFGHGKEILRARYKFYLADPAIAPAILMKGKSLLEDSTALGHAVETAVFAHLKMHNIARHALFGYWKDQKSKELDLVMQSGTKLFPFEIKYQSQQMTPHILPGLISFCEQKKSVQAGYVLTKNPSDIGVLNSQSEVPIVRIPASLFCFLLGRAELERLNLFV